MFGWTYQVSTPRDLQAAHRRLVFIVARPRRLSVALSRRSFQVTDGQPRRDCGLDRRSPTRPRQNARTARCKRLALGSVEMVVPVAAAVGVEVVVVMCLGRYWEPSHDPPYLGSSASEPCWLGSVKRCWMHLTSHSRPFSGVGAHRSLRRWCGTPRKPRSLLRESCGDQLPRLRRSLSPVAHTSRTTCSPFRRRLCFETRVCTWTGRRIASSGAMLALRKATRTSMWCRRWVCLCRACGWCRLWMLSSIAVRLLVHDLAAPPRLAADVTGGVTASEAESCQAQGSLMCLCIAVSVSVSRVSCLPHVVCASGCRSQSTSQAATAHTQGAGSTKRRQGCCSCQSEACCRSKTAASTEPTWQWQWWHRRKGRLDSVETSRSVQL